MENLEQLTKEFFIDEGHEYEIVAEQNNSRLRSWVGTWNNPDMNDDEFRIYLGKLYEDEVIQYAVFQRESAPTTGTQHYQWFISFVRPVYFKKVKELFPKCHFAPMKSTPDLCRAYCRKEESRLSGPYEVGEFLGQGKRSDIARAIELLKSGASLKDIDELYPTVSVTYGHKLSEYYYRLKNAPKISRLEKCATQWRNLEIIYIYGPPRTGKSTSVRYSTAQDELFCVTQYDQNMFDGYNGQSVLLIDEFYSQIQLTRINQILEPSPMLLNVKNSRVQAAYDKVYIISNYPLNDLYSSVRPAQDPSYKAFCARINKIIRFDEYGKQHIERDSEWEDTPQSELDEHPFIPTKRVSRTYEYDCFGNRRIIFDRHPGEQIDMLPADPDELPF